MNLLSQKDFYIGLNDSKDLLNNKFIYESYSRLKKDDLKEGKKYLIANDKKAILINIGADNLFIFKDIKTNDIYNIYYHNLSGFFEYADGTKTSVTKISWKIMNWENHVYYRTLLLYQTADTIVLTDKGKIGFGF
jgi:hypothetical protein